MVAVGAAAVTAGSRGAGADRGATALVDDPARTTAAEVVGVAARAGERGVPQRGVPMAVAVAQGGGAPGARTTTEAVRIGGVVASRRAEGGGEMAPVRRLTCSCLR